MKQKTVKTAIEAWHWINNNAHQEVGTEYHATKLDGEGLPLRTHMFFKNYFETMRVPEALCSEVFSMIAPNKRAFDTRMFALKAGAKRAIAGMEKNDADD